MSNNAARFSAFIGKAVTSSSGRRRTALAIGGALTYFPILVFFKNHVAQIMTIHGPSMAPGLSPNYNSYGEMDRVWAKMWNPSQGLERGMLVAFWSPQDPEKGIVKRIVALEGDVVQTRAPYPLPTATVPVGHVWVQGDDGTHSIDSNEYGPISKSLIIAQITHLVWPLSRAGRITWEDWKGKAIVEKAAVHKN